MTTMTQTVRTLASTNDDGRLLRLALRLDAAASGALGLLALAAARSLDDLLGMGVGPLRAVGAFLMAYAAGLALLAATRRIPRAGAWTVVVGNVGWAVGTGVLAVAVHDLTAVGTAVVLAQATAVLVFADLQWIGLRRSR